MTVQSIVGSQVCFSGPFKSLAMTQQWLFLVKAHCLGDSRAESWQNWASHGMFYSSKPLNIFMQEEKVLENKKHVPGSLEGLMLHRVCRQQTAKTCLSVSNTQWDSWTEIIHVIMVKQSRKTEKQNKINKKENKGTEWGKLEEKNGRKENCQAHKPAKCKRKNEKILSCCG